MRREGITYCRICEAQCGLRVVSEADRVLRIEPDRSSVMNNLALTLAQRGCKQAALSVMQCALRHAPDDANLLLSYQEIKGFQPGAEVCKAFVCGSGEFAVSE